MDPRAKCAAPAGATVPIRPFSATSSPTPPTHVSIVPDSMSVVLPPTAHNFPARILPGTVPQLVQTAGHTLQTGVPDGHFHLAKPDGQIPQYRCDRKVQDLVGSRRPG